MHKDSYKYTKLRKRLMQIYKLSHIVIHFEWNLFAGISFCVLSSFQRATLVYLRKYVGCLSLYIRLMVSPI